MKKSRYSLCLGTDTMSIIDKIAIENNISRSAVVRMFLDMAKQVPAENLRFSSPIPNLLGLPEEVNHENG